MVSASQPASARTVLRFAGYELDVHAGELRKFGTRVPLQQQPLQILVALVKQAGEIVTREELRQLLWPADTFVDFEHSLNSAVKKLRRALNDDPIMPRFVETIPRRGYRFLAPVTRVENRVSAESTAPSLGEKRDSAGARRWRRPAVIGVAAAVLLVAIGVTSLWYFVSRRSGAGRHPVESLAVLPLQNLSSDPEQEYFVDGLTDALITNLGKMGGVRVISRTSVMRYKGTTKPLPVVARELNVDSVIEGTVLRSGNHVRVTTQLVRAEPEEHLWAESYEGDLSNVLLLQDKISRNIASKIQAQFRSQELSAGAAVRQVNSEAYDLYLRGRYFFERRGESETRKAISYFEQAIQKDPSYAPAYSGLADCYIVTWAGALHDNARGESYARQALKLQDDLAEAHASLGVARLYQFDLRTAQTELQRAIELNPNYSMAHHWYALYLMASGRLEDALAENDAARQINPFSLPINNARGIILTNMRRYDEALEHAERLREMEYDYAAHGLAARVYRLEKKHREAVAEQERSVLLLGDRQAIEDQKELTRVFAESGYAAYLQKSVELKQKHYPKPYAAIDLAFDCFELGKNAEAFMWLERAYKDQDFFILMLNVAPEADPLRSDPRFQDMLRRFQASE